MPIAETPRARQRRSIRQRKRAGARGDYSTGRLTAACGDQRDEQHFGGRKERREGKWRRTRPPSARCKPDLRDVDELNQRRRSAHPFQSAPIGVVAQITSGVARRTRWEAGWPHGAKQSRERCGTAKRAWSPERNSAAWRTTAARIRVQDRKRIARPRLDAEVPAPCGNAKHQNDVGLAGKELRQIAIHGRVSGRKDVRRAGHISKRGPAPAGERLYQDRARIEGRARERPEADQNDTHLIGARANRRSARRRHWLQGARRRHRPRSAAAPL